MPAQLVALNEGPSILLDKPILLLGRHPECDVQIDSRKISGRHCCIAQINDYLIVRDLGSTNGIRINGQRVAEGRLGPGDELTIGNHRYQVSWGQFVQTPPRQKKKETFRVSTPDGPVAEDDLLESCDEPVPLPDPGMPFGSVPTPRGPGMLPKPPTEEDQSYILPDELELAPGSGAPPQKPKSSGSHHPAT